MCFKLAAAALIIGISGYSAGLSYGGISGISRAPSPTCFLEDKSSRAPSVAYEFDRFIAETSNDSRLGGKKIVHSYFYSERYGQRMFASGYFIENKPEGLWEIRGSMDNITITVGFLNGKYDGVFFIDNQKWHYYSFASFRNGTRFTDWSIL
jgi:hypothetical protein